ncbi:PspC domain-containing protein [Moheibacter sp.]|uniref:PspC domain-containing protein n=1 Tax=Moheibacter sp. TaxID=1965316 RepID=UPI003C72AA48
MDKTISISLGGFSFIVDDRAFFKLKNYLDDIRRSLQGMEGTEDIIADVEVRIAEIFKEKLGAREVVNEQDVDHIIEVMGRPEQYVDEDLEETTSYKSGSSYKQTASGEKVKRKLYRDPNDKIIAGVLSGLAHYLGVETWVTRLLWIVIFFSDVFISGASLTIISYIVLWIILPKAETATQKYEMYGQAGDFETIKKNASQAASEMKGVARDASSTLGNLFSVLGKIILIFIGIMLICTGIGLIIGAIALLITASSELPVQFFGYVVDYEWQDWGAKALILILMTIPAILLIILGARLISSRVKTNKTFVLSAVVLWFIALIASAVLVGTLFKNFTQDIEFTDKKAYTIAADTLTLSFEEYKDFGKRKIKWTIDNDMGGFVHFDGKLHRKIYDDIEIKTSPNDQVSVEILYYSKGSSMDDARKNADMITYNYKVNSKGEIIFDNYLSLPENSKFRDQLVSIVVYVPKGKTIYAKNVDDLIFYDEFENDRDYEDGTNKFYKFVNNQYECLNCGWNSSEDSIHTEFDSDSAKVRITKDGVHIQDGDEKVIINKNKINISDGTDSVNIDISGN